eukprot:TRINITY_DN7815_c0_g1_i6.p2 TRINITY_DN7815_c0_g1~~TRINITY_DN7815_c0_g1_i6.p2  ORF type:complete len:138 (-),score=32.33 TRINITY_DN7815_c0_g1_i6:100-513(-)
MGVSDTVRASCAAGDNEDLAQRLAARLSDPDAIVRQAAAPALAKLAAPANAGGGASGALAVKLLVRHLPELAADEDAAVRRAAAESFSFLAKQGALLRDAAVLSAVLDRLVEDEDDSVRRAATVASTEATAAAFAAS